MLENLAYALTQVLHNFGAVVVVGGAAAALWAPALPYISEKRLRRLVGIGWAVQIASGAGFGAVSYYFYGRLPDIHGVAVAALAIKVTCAVSGLGLAVLSLSRGDSMDRCEAAAPVARARFPGDNCARRCCLPSMVKESSTLRKSGILTGLLGLNAAALVSVPPATLVTGLAAAAVAMVAERATHLKEQGDLKDKEGYFLWKLQSAQPMK